MEFLLDFVVFFAKSITVVVSLLLLTAGIIALSSKNKSKDKGKLDVSKVNERYKSLADSIENEILDKKALKQSKKEQKKQLKQLEKNKFDKRIFVLEFKGDLRASAVESLRQEITALLHIAKPDDEVVVRLESGGGMVPHYGLAASQLQRIKDRRIHLTVTIDKVAASGGYLMACVADKILAAPFAIIGSIGVIGQLPNFNKFLKKHNIEMEQHTAGAYKRTLTMFGDNSKAAREKFREDLEDIHKAFKDFIIKHREFVDLDKVATGEHWLACDTLQLRLVDELITSDDYLFKKHDTCEIVELHFAYKKSLGERMMQQGSILLQQLGFNNNYLV